MATYEDAMIALRNADKAGDVAAARSLAVIAQKLKPGTAAPEAELSPMDQLQKIQPSAPAKPEVAAPSFGQKLLGAGEAALSAGSGLVAAPISALAGVGKGLIGGKYGTPEGVADAEKFASNVQDKLTYAPRTESGKNQIGGLSKVLEASKLQGLNPSLGAEVGVLAPMAARQLTGQVATVVPKVASAIGKAITPSITPEVADLARKATAAGIPLRPDMLTNNKLFKMVGESLEQAPLTGGQLEKRRIAFNRAVMDTIGADIGEERLTPTTFYNAMQKSGNTLGEIGKKYPIPIDESFMSAIKRHSAASEFETADTQRIIGNYINEISGKVANGQIDGTSLGKIRSQLTGQMRRTTDGSLRHALSKLDDDLLDSIQKQLPPEDLAAFNTARGQYARGKIIEPLVAGSTTGDIVPNLLMGRMNATASGKRAMASGYAGDLGDLARIGKHFLKEPTKTESALGLGVMGGGGVTGAVMAPGTTAGAYGAAQLYNRLGPKIAKKMIRAPKQ